MSRPVTAYPWGDVPLPGPPVHMAPDEPAGLSGIPPASRFEGRDDTLNLIGPVGAGEAGWTGRDPTDPADAVPEGQGMFSRLHQEGAP